MPGATGLPTKWQSEVGPSGYYGGGGGGGCPNQLNYFHAGQGGAGGGGHGAITIIHIQTILPYLSWQQFYS